MLNPLIYIASLCKNNLISLVLRLVLKRSPLSAKKRGMIFETQLSLCLIRGCVFFIKMKARVRFIIDLNLPPGGRVYFRNDFERTIIITRNDSD